MPHFVVKKANPVDDLYAVVEQEADLRRWGWLVAFTLFMKISVGLITFSTYYGIDRELLRRDNSNLCPHGNEKKENISYNYSW